MGAPKLLRGIALLPSLFLALAVSAQRKPIAPTVYTVTNTNADTSPGSLGAALLAAKSSAGGTIDFAIPGTGPFIITEGAGGFIVPANTTLDGTSQTNYAGSPLIEIDFSNNGITAGAGSVVEGLSITGAGIKCENNSTIQACWLGIQANGAPAASTILTDIDVNNATNVLIGGANFNQGNTIAGADNGIWVRGTGTVIEGNFIGTNPAGEAADANSFGIFLGDCSNVQVGTLYAGNVISGNDVGIGDISSSVTTQVSIVDNLIGLDANGEVALGNQYGIYDNATTLTVGGPSPSYSNFISGNDIGFDDVSSGTPLNCMIEDNFFGINESGLAVGNVVGLSIQTDTVTADQGGNTIISGNEEEGVEVLGTAQATISNCAIGLDPFGDPLANGGDGIDLTSVGNGGSLVVDNLIACNTGNGVTITGSSQAASENNQILDNEISANGGAGVKIGFFDDSGDLTSYGSSGNLIQGNIIGTPIDDPAGSEDNVEGGIVVGGPGYAGVNFSASNTFLQNGIWQETGSPILLSAGTNGGLTAPSLIASSDSSGASIVTGTFAANPNTTYNIEYFDTFGPNGPATGTVYLGSQAVTTDVNGNASLTFTAFTAYNSDEISATASDPTGNTSPLSSSVTYTGAGYLAPPILQSVQVANNRLKGHSSTTGTVTLSAAQATPTLVALGSDTSLLQVPIYVTVPAGQTTQTFQATTSSIPANSQATLEAYIPATLTTPYTTVNLLGAFSNFYVSPTSVVGGHSTRGVVQLVLPASGVGANVIIQSSSADAILPTVTVPGGSTGFSFAINTAVVSSPEQVTLTASYNGSSLGTTFTINPAPISNFYASPSAVTGGHSTYGVVQLGGQAGPSGDVVSLQSASADVTVPATVTVPAGLTGVSFLFTSSVVSASEQVTLTATLGPTSLQTTVTVNSANISNFYVSPSSIVGGTSTRGVVQLTSPAGPGGDVVSLSTSDPNVSIPATVTVPAGQTGVSFPITTTAVGTSDPVNIVASFGAYSFQAILVLNP